MAQGTYMAGSVPGAVIRSFESTVHAMNANHTAALCGARAHPDYVPFRTNGPMACKRCAKIVAKS